MVSKRKNVAERLASEAIRLGSDALQVEYKGDYEEVFAVKGGVGCGIARFRNSSPEAAALRDELHVIVRQRRRITVDGREYELRGRVYDSFGEEAFHVHLRRL